MPVCFIILFFLLSLSLLSQIYIFGGKTGLFSVTNDFLVLDPSVFRSFLQFCTVTETKTLQKVIAKGPAPSARFGHAAIVVGQKMFISGGSDNHETFEDIRIFNFGLPCQP